jgi:lysophospholipase L1-like esterase
MASVWYTGRADTRTITAADWAAAGIVGGTDTVWNRGNGWSVPQSSLTVQQRAILDADGKFNTNAPDGPRPDDSVSSGDPNPLPQYFLRTDFSFNWRAQEQSNWPTHAKSSARTSKFNSAKSVYNLKRSNTLKTTAALGRALNGMGLARIAIFGDSKSDTYNGNGAVGGHDDKFSKWPHKLKNLLGVPVAGTGFAKFWQAGVYDPRLTFTGAWTNTVAGPYVYAGAGATLTFDNTVTGEKGTVVEIVYMDYQATQWTVSVDGASSGAGFVTVTNGNTGTTLKKLTLAGLANTTHSVKITITAGAMGFYQGICIRGTSGLLVDNWSINGGASNMFRPTAAIGKVAKFYVPDPDLVIVPLGINDLTAQGLTVSQTIANITGLRTDYPNSDFLLVGEEFTSVDSTLWTTYLGKLYDTAETLDVPLLDLAHRFTSNAAETAAGLMVDAVHQNASGDGAWARTFADLLMGA